MERVIEKADPALGWAFRPDAVTLAALSKGRGKLRNHPELGSDRPHRGSNLAQSLKEARAVATRKPKPGRRRQVAKKVTNLKEMARRSKTKADFDIQPSRKKTAAPVSKKRTVVAEEKSPAKGSKMIPLKVICADLDLDPKATRVKLRRMIAKGEIDFHDHSQRWEFTQSQAKEIRNALS